jgi:hypothetical protein
MSCGRSPRFRAMTGTEPKTTLREFREYFASSYEALGKLAARIGVTHPTLADVLANRRALARLWLKIKSRPQQEFVACGFNEGKGSRKYFGVLLLATYRNGKLGLIRFGDGRDLARLPPQVNPQIPASRGNKFRVCCRPGLRKRRRSNPDCSPYKLLAPRFFPPASPTSFAIRSTSSRVSAQNAIRVPLGRWFLSSSILKNSIGRSAPPA